MVCSCIGTVSDRSGCSFLFTVGRGWFVAVLGLFLTGHVVVSCPQSVDVGLLMCDLHINKIYHDFCRFSSIN